MLQRNSTVVTQLQFFGIPNWVPSRCTPCSPIHSWKPYLLVDPTCSTRLNSLFNLRTSQRMCEGCHLQIFAQQRQRSKLCHNCVARGVQNLLPTETQSGTSICDDGDAQCLEGAWCKSAIDLGGYRAHCIAHKASGQIYTTALKQPSVSYAPRAWKEYWDVEGCKS